MGIKIEFKSALKSVTGTQSVNLNRTFNTFEKVIAELLRLYPRLKDEMFYSDGTLDYAYQIILNGQRLSWPEDKEVRVKDGDSLILMLFMAGG